MSKIVSYTDSALVEKIKNEWSHYVDRKQEFPKNGVGMFYLYSFIESIWNNTILEIHLKHFSPGLLLQFQQLAKENPLKLQSIIKRAIKEFLGKYEGSTYDNAEKENRLKWILL